MSKSKLDIFSYMLGKNTGESGGGGLQVTSLTITTLPYITEYFVGTALDLTGMVVTATFSDGLTANLIDNVTTIPSEGTILSTEGTISISVSYQGVSTSFNVQCFALPSNLNNITWRTLNGYIKLGKFASIASVGDTKSFVMNDKTYNAEVVSINDGIGDAGQWYPNKTVDFICKELYETTYSFNSTRTNVGGFPASNIRGMLENTLYPLLPQDLKNVIVAKSHLYNTSTSADGTMITDSTKLWLPANYEIFGTTQSYDPGETASNNKLYTLTSKIKQLNGQTSNENWLLSALRSYNTNGCWYVMYDGSDGYGNADVARGVPICFRIG